MREKIELFNGKDMSGWTSRWSKGIPNWTVDEDGVVLVGNEDIISDYTFGDAHVHVEWREPDMPDCSGQEKGNSGVYVHGCYEVQVLDSYGIENPLNNDRNLLDQGSSAKRMQACSRVADLRYHLPCAPLQSVRRDQG